MADAEIAAQIVPITTPADCERLATLLARVWGFAESTAVAAPDMLPPRPHSEGYVAGVIVDGHLVGGGFGWPTHVAGEWRLHSHVIGFIEEFRSRGLGAQ